MSDEPKQLKLTPRSDGETRGKKEKKEEKANKWVVVLILLITLVVTLVFYFSGGRRPKLLDEGSQSEKGGLFGPKIYEF